jgi:hypothetical protein
MTFFPIRLKMHSDRVFTFFHKTGTLRDNEETMFDRPEDSQRHPIRGSARKSLED